MTGLQGEIPFSNSPRLHDRIGNVKTNKKDLAKSAFRNAEEFYIGAGLIFVQDIQLIQVVSVNLAFACELYLKAMLYELNVDFGRTHRIVELFRLLPEEYQKKIKANAHFKYDKEDNFHLILEEISDTFVFLRYSHERKAVVGNWDGLSTISTAMMKVSREVVEKISS